MRTANPALIKLVNIDQTQAKSSTMTIRGTVIATSILLAICAIAAVLMWNAISTSANLNLAMTVGLGTMLGGMVVGLIVGFVPKAAPILGPLYAAAQGTFLACISYFITVRYLGQADTGVIFQAIIATFSIMAGLLIAFSAGLIRISGTVARVMVVLASGLMIYFLVFLGGNLLLGLNIPNLWASTSPLGLAFTAGLVILASFFLVLDFQFVQAGVQNKAPRYMEWYAGVGLLATLVWLYVEILRLILKVRSVME